MRVTTLKATAAKLPGLLAYYAGLAEDRERPGPGRGPVDYYLDPGVGFGPPVSVELGGVDAVDLVGPGVQCCRAARAITSSSGR